MATFQVNPPDSFDFTTPEEWPKWLRRFERFRVASGLSAKEEEAQVNTLIYCMGDQADDILRSFNLSAEDAKKFDTVKGHFENHFIKRRNVIFERAKFNNRRQEAGEPVDSFITDLYALAEHCNYATLHDEMIRDRIVVGIQDQRLSERLQLDPELTLGKAVAQVRQSEAVKKQQPLIRGDNCDTPVGAIHKRRCDKKNNSPRSTSAKTSTMSGGTCSWCGKSPIHDRQHCPARGVTCHRCSKRGHFQSVCRSSPHASPLHLDPPVQADCEVPEAFLGGVTEQGKQNSWIVSLQLNGFTTKLLIDTGAEVTVVSEATHKAIGSPPLSSPSRTLKGPSNYPLPVKGYFVGCLKNDTKEVAEEVYVVQNLHQQLLGRPAIAALGLVVRAGAITVNNAHPTIQFPQLFSGLGKLEGAYSIQLKEGAEPFALTVPRRVAIPLMEQVKKELERMEKMGVIARVDEPTDWCAGMVVVPKPNGKVRICVDLTKLNKNVRRERHLMPATDQILAQLPEACVFSKLDANSGFWQIPLSAEAALLTTFITPLASTASRLVSHQPQNISSEECLNTQWFGRYSVHVR